MFPMSAIYQRARPIRWEDVVGQGHVKDVLKVALEQGRLGHAYLFSGPRGVGKTTTARLIAMTANCTGPDPKPCGECESCLSVRAGSHPDVMEIDAASNNSVDDVRDLREKVGLAAMRGGKKIYILDEAHMMSRSAFNALLKTLEEPPPHVIFILATTEPEKIIPTILSRCQHYRFRRLTPEEIAGKLAGLAAGEGAHAEPEALALIGRLADGAMRDGESLLERMLAAGTAVTRAGVEEALGLPPGERVRGVAAALVAGDAGAALSGAAALYRDGFAARKVVGGLVSALGAALHAELGLGDQEARLEGADLPRLLRLQAALDEQDSRFARAADGQSLELALTHALLAAGQGAGGESQAPAQAANPASPGLPTDLTQRLNRLEKEVATLRASPPARAPGPAPAAADPTAPVPASVPAQAAPAPSAAARSPGAWDDFLKRVVALGGQQLRAFVREGRPEFRAEGLVIVFDKLDKARKPSNRFHADGVVRNKEAVIAAAREVFGDLGLYVDSYGDLTRLVGGEGSPPPPTPPETPGAGLASEQAAPEPQAGQIQAAEVGAAALTSPASPVPDASEASVRRPRRGPAFEPVEAQAPVGVGTPAPSPSSTLPPARPGLALPPRPATPGAGGSLLAPAPSAPLQARAPEARQRSPLRPAPPPSPDDLGPAPLPDRQAAPWEEADLTQAAPAPADAQGGDRQAPAQTAPRERSLYLGEVMTEEPDWDDFGAPLGDDLGTDPLQGAPFAEYSAPRPVAPPRPAPSSGAPAQAQGASGPSRPGDIRAHPMFDEIKGRFSGRVKEIGKNRRVVAVSEAPEDAEPDAEER